MVPRTALLALVVFHPLLPLSAYALCVTDRPSWPLTYYVSPYGNDDHSCTTLTTPCLTLNVAIQKAVRERMVTWANGIRIVLRGGRYYDTSVAIKGYSGAATGPLMIEAYSGEAPQFNNLQGFVVSGSSHVNVCDIQIRWAVDDALSFRDSTAVSLENVLAYYSGMDPMTGMPRAEPSTSNGIRWSNVSSSRMINVKVSRSGSHGIYLTSSFGNALRNITTTVNAGSGLAIQSGMVNFHRAN
jgi:hypothetical protein